MAVYVSPVAYMLMHIRNAEKTHLESISMPAHEFLIDIAKCLREAGYIRDYKVVKKRSSAGVKESPSKQKSAGTATLMLYLDEGEKIPKIRLSGGRMVKETESKDIRLLVRDIKSPAIKNSAAKRSAIRRAVIMTAIKSMTETNSAPGK